MIYRDPRCVFIADNPGLAELIAGWLCDKGLPAEVMNPLTLGGLPGLTPFSVTGASPAGVEVWVADPSQAPEASRLLAEYEQARADRTAAAEAAGEAEVVCEECGKKSTFPARDRGTVQDCRHCGAYVDVPGEDEGWDDEGAEGEDGDT